MQNIQISFDRQQFNHMNTSHHDTDDTGILNVVQNSLIWVDEFFAMSFQDFFANFEEKTRKLRQNSKIRSISRPIKISNN